jgi:hypothetical protein
MSGRSGTKKAATAAGPVQKEKEKRKAGGEPAIAMLAQIDEEGNLKQAAAGAGSAADDQKAAQKQAAGGDTPTAADAMDVEPATEDGTKSGEQAGSSHEADKPAEQAAADAKPAAPADAAWQQATGGKPKSDGKAGLGAQQAAKPAAGDTKPGTGSKQGTGAKGQPMKRPWAPAAFVTATQEDWKQVEADTHSAVPLVFKSSEHISRAGDAFGQIPPQDLAKAMETAMRARVAQELGEVQGLRVRASASWHDLGTGLAFYSIRVMLPATVADRMQAALTKPGSTATVDVTVPDGTSLVMQLHQGSHPLHLMRLITDDEVQLSSVLLALRTAVASKQLPAAHWVGEVTDSAEGSVSVLPITLPQQLQEQAAGTQSAQPPGPVPGVIPPWARQHFPAGSFVALAAGGDAMHRAGMLAYGKEGATGRGKTVAERGALVFKLARYHGSVQHPVGAAGSWAKPGKPGGRRWERTSPAPPAPPAGSSKPSAIPAPNSNPSVVGGGNAAHQKASNTQHQQHQGKQEGSTSSNTQQGAKAPPAIDPNSASPQQDPTKGHDLVNASASSSIAEGAAAASSGAAGDPPGDDPPPVTPGAGQKKTGGQENAEDQQAGLSTPGLQKDGLQDTQAQHVADFTPLPAVAKKRKGAEGQQAKAEAEADQVTLGINEFCSNRYSEVMIHADMQQNVAKEIVRTSLKVLADEALTSQEIMGGLTAPPAESDADQLAAHGKAHGQLLNSMAKAVMDVLVAKHGGVQTFKIWLLAGSLEGIMSRQQALSLMRAVVKDEARMKGQEVPPSSSDV